MGFVLVFLAPSVLGGAQGGPAIAHQVADCVAPGQFPLFWANIQPPNDIRTAKLYFRSDKYPDFYYVEMTPIENRFRAILPKPGVDTDRIVYYIEAVDGVFGTARTEELTSEVKTPCRRDPQGAYFTGTDPGIIVGAAEAGAAAVPPGFEAVGIVGFVTAAGLASGTGGGVGAVTGVAIGAGAAGASIGVLTRREDTTSTSIVVGSPGTTSTTTSTAPPGGGPQTTTSSSTTTTVSGGGITTTSVSPTSTVSPGSSTSTTTTSTPSALSACFTFQITGRCRVLLDATCSQGSITEYQWEFVRAPGGPQEETRLTSLPFEHDWSDDQACRGDTCGFRRNVRLTVSGPKGTEKTQTAVDVSCSGLASLSTERLALTLASFFELEAVDGAVGQLEFPDGRVETLEEGVATSHRFESHPGENLVRAWLRGSGEAGFWRFDFTGQHAFVPWSIEVLEGEVSSRTASYVVFRLQGNPGESVRFRFRLAP